MTTEQTYVMIKPDGVQRGICGDIISRFERKGLKLVAAKLMFISKPMAELHYSEHKNKQFFSSLISYITSGPVLAMIWKGDNAVQICRNLIGKTNPQEAAPGTIRGDFGIMTSNNIVHGSDSVDSARREISIFFKPEEISVYDKSIDKWIYE